MSKNASAVKIIKLITLRIKLNSIHSKGHKAFTKLIQLEAGLSYTSSIFSNMLSKNAEEKMI
jgi:hypothetical protein